jgi:catechol 2,3-dioxygenase-like lactoylglutathione lyase family enzyme
MKLHLAMIFAKDMPRMTAFYRDVLGLPVIPAESQEGWVVFDAGGARFALHQIPPAYAAGIVITTPPEVRSDTAIKLTFTTDDLPAAVARLDAAGIQWLPVRNPQSRDGVDPEGNVFQIWTGAPSPHAVGSGVPAQ